MAIKLWIKGDRETAIDAANERGVKLFLGKDDNWNCFVVFAESVFEDEVCKWFAEVNVPEGTEYPDGSLLFFQPDAKISL